ncbi:MAG: D-isomer-specific 2-hydroxyacid dehydrogenase, NAD-binding protein [Polyangiaceae bacterium]|jgi:phosphoglycerate dehydrogenase-like enzyme|nr:D-isomer-specific 2-hydroxyacid dehydrogenase, NAD-binding protein [Polyangiaceae bacterium]
MKVVIWLESPIRAFDLSSSQLEALRSEYPQHDFVVAESRDAFLALIPSAEAALVWRFAAEWYPRAPLLRLVATPSAGRELVDMDPQRRVRVSHGSFHGKIMAESLLAMMLFHSRRLDLCLSQQQQRLWDRDAFGRTRRLAGQSALIVGYGPLGRQCARLLKAVGMSVTGVKRSPAGDPAPADAVHPVSELRRLLPQADHVVLTLPSDTGTDHLIDEAALRLLKPSASLYNLGRGNAVDEAALVRALGAGQLGHAFLDVFHVEPLPADSPLWDVPNLHVMPHASAISSEYLNLWLEELAPELR